MSTKVILEGVASQRKSSNRDHGSLVCQLGELIMWGPSTVVFSFTKNSTGQVHAMTASLVWP